LDLSSKLNHLKLGVYYYYYGFKRTV